MSDWSDRFCSTVALGAILWTVPCAAQTFTDVTESAGLFVENLSWAAAWSDYDGDGDLDLYTPSHWQQFNEFVSQLWRNNGDGTFSDVTMQTGLVPRNGDPHSACWADLDRDRDPDLVINKSPGPVTMEQELWRNDDGRSFANIAMDSGFESPYASRGVSAVDYNLDGQLDLLALGRLTTTGNASRLYRNEGGLKLTDVSAQAGSMVLGEYYYTAAWSDYDGDGLPDVLVARPCSLWRNQGDGSFADVTLAAGIGPDAECVGSSWADYDNDGDQDLYVTSGLLYGDPPEQTTAGFLYRNEGDGTFLDVTAASGTANPHSARGASWGDYDNDGDPDLYVVNVENATTANRLFRNEGDGTFTDVAIVEGAGAQVKGGGLDGNFVDYDDDGDLDLFVTNGGKNLSGPYTLLENAGNGNHWMKIGLRGLRSSTSGLMARVSLVADDGITQYREHNGPTHFMAQDDAPVHFGLGAAGVVERLSITWPTGLTQVIENLATDQTVTITEGVAIAKGLPKNLVPGFSVYLSPLGWHLQWRGEEGLRSFFSGRITSSGAFSSVEALGFEPNDTLSWSAEVIDFSGYSDGVPDTLRFNTTSQSVTFELYRDGVADPRAVHIGRFGVVPGSLPLTLNR